MPNDLADILGPDITPVPVKDIVRPDRPELTAEEFVKHVGYMEMISLRASEPIRRLWDRAWGLYNNS